MFHLPPNAHRCSSPRAPYFVFYIPYVLYHSSGYKNLCSLAQFLTFFVLSFDTLGLGCPHIFYGTVLK